MKHLSRILTAMLIVLTIATAALFAKPQGTLSVVTSTPQGDLYYRPSAFSVVLNRSMTALKVRSGEQENTFFKIEPPLEGKVLYLQDNTVQFLPKGDIVPNTVYEVTVPKGTESHDGAALEEDYTFSFIYDRITVSIYPTPFYGRLMVTNEFRLHFSHPVDPKALTPYVALEAGMFGREVPFSLAYEKDEDNTYSNLIIVTPKEEYYKTADVSVIVKPGKYALVGNGTLRNNVEGTYKVHSGLRIKKDRIRFSSCHDKRVVVVFNNPVHFNDVKKAFRFSVIKAGNGQKAQPPLEEMIAGDADDTRLVSAIPVNAEIHGGGKYEVSFVGLKDVYGEELDADEKVVITANDYEGAALTPTGLYVIPAKYFKGLPAMIMNKDEVTYKGAAIKAKDVPELIYEQQYSGSGSFYLNENPEAGMSRWALRSYDMRVPTKVEEWSAQYLPIHRRLMQGDHGIFYINNHYRSRCINNRKREAEMQALVQVTDIGITLRYGHASNFVMTTDLVTGKPLPDTKISVYTGYGKRIYRTKTGDDGTANIPGADELGLSDEYEMPDAFYVVAERGRDTAFVATASPNLYRGGEGVYSGEYQKEREKILYLFAEKDLFRAGEKVHVKGILRDLSFSQLLYPERIELGVSVFDPRDKSMTNLTVKPDKEGNFDFVIETSDEYTRGEYTIYVAENDVDNYYYQYYYYSLGDLQFNIEDFTPINFTLAFSADKTELMRNESATFSYKGEYLFGAPTSEKQVETRLSVSPITFRPPGQANNDFSFTYFNSESAKHERGISLDVTNALDKEGVFEKTIDGLWNNVSNTCAVSVTATLVGDNEDRMNKSQHLVVHPATSYPGVARSVYYPTVGKEMQFALVAADTKGVWVKGVSYHVTVNEIRYEGGWSEANIVRTPAYEEDVTTGENSALSPAAKTYLEGIKAKVKTEGEVNPVIIPFTPQKAGTYEVVCETKTQDGLTLSTTMQFYAIGGDYTPWFEMDRDVEILPDKDYYEVGDTAKLLIKSKFTNARALITIERDFVIEHFVRDIDSQLTLIEVPVTELYLPNAYVGVQIISKGEDVDYTNSTEGIPEARVSYKRLDVAYNTRELDVTITPLTTTTEPGEEVKIAVAVKDASGNPMRNADVTFAVCDEGVLALTGYETPNPLSTFYQTRKLTTFPVDSRSMILSSLPNTSGYYRSYPYPGYYGGGGMYGDRQNARAMMLEEDAGMVESPTATMAKEKSFDGEEAKKNDKDMPEESGEEEEEADEDADVEVRSNFLGLAFYKALSETDSDGNVIFTFAMPDNLTAFRVMAVASGKERFGSGEGKVVVKKDIMTYPTFPNFAQKGDTFDAGATIHNYTGEDREFTVSVKVKGVTLVGDAKKTVTIKKDDVADVRFAFLAEKETDAEATVIVRSGDKSDAFVSKFPVTCLATKEYVTWSFSTTNDTEEHAVTMPTPDEVRTNEGYTGSIEGFVSPTILSGMKSSVDYLVNYPYPCLEQKISRAFPFALMKDFLIKYKLTSLEEKEIDKVVKEVLGEMHKYVVCDDYFSYWQPPYHYPSVWLTAYAIDFLSTAKAHGYDIPENLLENAVDRIKRYVKGDPGCITRHWWPEDTYSHYLSPYLLYVLSLNGETHDKTYARLLEDAEHLSVYALSYLLRYAKNTDAKAEDRQRIVKHMENYVHFKGDLALFEIPSEFMWWYVHDSSERSTGTALSALSYAGYNVEYKERLARFLVRLAESKKKEYNTQVAVSSLEGLYYYVQENESVTPDFTCSITVKDKPVVTGRMESLFTPPARGELSFTNFDFGEEVTAKVSRQGVGRAYYTLRLSYYPPLTNAGYDAGIEVTRTVLDESGEPLTGDLTVGTTYTVVLNVRTRSEHHFVVLDDPIPAGCKVVNPNLESGTRESSYNYFYGFGFRERRFERFLAFANWLNADRYEIRYQMRAVTPGTYTYEGSYVKEMYNESIFGREGGRMVDVVR